MKRSLVLVFAVLLVLSFLVLPSAWAGDKLVMGVHPYRPAADLNKIFVPIADYISQKVGKPVEFRIGKSHGDAVDLVGKGQVDFSFLGPALYVDAKDKYNVKPLAQISNNGRPSFYGVIVVKKGSGITSVRDLKGRTFAFGDRDSTLTYMVPAYMLRKAGIKLSDLKKYSFVGSNDNVAQSVLNGTADAAGLQPDVVAKYKSQGLEVIAQSMDIPEHVFVASKSLDAATTAKIQDALLNIDIKLLKGIKGSVSEIGKFDDRDFDILRQIMSTVEKEEVKTK